MPQAATLIGVSPQYLRNVAMATAKERNALGNVAGNVAEVDGPLPALDGPYLDAARAGPGGHWRVRSHSLAELVSLARNLPDPARFMPARAYRQAAAAVAAAACLDPEPASPVWAVAPPQVQIDGAGTGLSAR